MCLVAQRPEQAQWNHEWISEKKIMFARGRRAVITKRFSNPTGVNLSLCLQDANRILV